MFGSYGEGARREEARRLRSNTTDTRNGTEDSDFDTSYHGGRARLASPGMAI